MAFTRVQAYQRLLELNPAPVFLDCYKVKSLPEQLDIYFGPLEEFFIAADTQEPYTSGRLIPILDDGNFGIITFCDPSHELLVQFDIESPQKPLNEFQNWQQYLADLLVRVGESADDDKQVQRIADLIQFRHSAALFEFFSRTSEMSHDKYHQFRNHFISSIQ